MADACPNANAAQEPGVGSVKQEQAIRRVAARFRRLGSMRLKIDTADLQIGMYVCGITGSWFQHPLWRTRFAVDSMVMLRALQAGVLQEIWIDTERGLAPRPPEAAPLLTGERTNHRLPERDQATPAHASTDLGVAGAVAAATDGIAAPTNGPAAAIDPLSPTIASLAADHPATTPASEPVPVPLVTVAQEAGQARVLSRECMHTVRRMFSASQGGQLPDCTEALAAVEQIWASVRRNPAALVSLSRIREHDEERYMHSVAVCGLMVGLAQQMQLDTPTIRLAGLAGLVHDLGRTTLPPPLAMLQALPDDPAARLAFSRYPQAGAELLNAEQQVPDLVIQATAQHRERFDGSGFPAGLHGAQITLLARMLAVCDDYDGLASEREGGGALSPSAAVRQLAQASGADYDPVLLQHFVRSVGIYPVGSLVRLQSNQLAVVCEPAHHSLLQPVVKVFFSLATQGRVRPQRIDLELSDDRIVSRENPGAWGFQGLNELWMV